MRHGQLVKTFFGFQAPGFILTLDRIDRGEAVGQDAFKAIAFDVEALTWGKAIGWHEEDMEDIQLSDFRSVVAALAKRAATLPEEIFFQILTAGASARPHPVRVASERIN